MTIGCPECGALEDIPPLAAHSYARCRTCHYPLERRSGRSQDAALACAASTFALLFPANLAPLMYVRMLGVEHSSLLSSGIVAMWNEGWVILAVLLGTFGIVLPFVRFGGLVIVLTALRLGRPARGMGALFRWTTSLDIWTMPDVYLVGCFVGYARVTQNLNGTIAPGGYCFIAAALLSMLTRASLDRRAVWRAIGGENALPEGEAPLSCTVCDLVMPMSHEGRPCPRCGLTLRARKTDAVVRAAALSLAALVLTVPANLFPMTSSLQLGRTESHRIIDGVYQLFHAGLWPLGILIICTSIVIPVAKIAGMAWFVVSVRRRSRRHLRVKAHLYRLIDELGRWSYVDVFTIAAFVPLIQFDGIASARPATGAPAFALVVFLTMAASRAFDPRLMWDVHARSER
ncbi:paraquat-inducible protein A [Paraburkholderia phenoliruptrix]|uniref:Paraquat-inducible protein A n=2 Tax=Paraburkholderia phenoliruptrix TaxID=252970 RepID=K0DSY6_9BURK|nr:paraquat-inducible protein A [Paraburkholderia phenoliruptrix]AFT88060.1 paraquat-inducible protein A [Paraburkholderia phenoliruptrix BR3459a]MDR6418308.1 paraquat-inducible protein A [Paraburkholderia phenoliruptrix]CAB4046977.1 Intermembrane transport protein YebS [Paraburkholderia phenoliruptrix]